MTIPVAKQAVPEGGDDATVVSSGAQLDDGDFESAVSALSAAFGDPTRRRLYLYVRDHADGVLVGDAATFAGVKHHVAYRHLEHLVAGGYLRSEEPPKGQVPRRPGRPARRYVAVPMETPVVANSSAGLDDLLVSLLGRALSMLAPDDAQRLAEEVGEQYGRELARQMSPNDATRSFRSALQSVAAALTAHGFAAHTEARGSSLAIIAEHCPFGVTADENPVICGVDRGMVRGMLAELYGDTAPVTLASRAQGHGSCVTVV